MKLIIIGGGPAGLMCASICSKNKNNEVILLDGNEKLGKKLYITGKGRCNLSNLCEEEEFLKNVVRNEKFLYGILNTFSPKDAVTFFENNGLKTKVERGNRVFPESDKASDVTRVFERICTKNGVKINLNSLVKSVKKGENNFVVTTQKDKFLCDVVVVATGGKSYSLTGSTGDGFSFAKSFSHSIVEPKPALVPIVLKDYRGENLSGLALKNVLVTVKLKNKKFSEFGEMLFTHTGVSGPAVLTLSSLITREDLTGAKLSIDLKPALSASQLNDRLIRDFSNFKTKIFKNYLKELLPSSLISEFIYKGKFDEKIPVCDITKEMRLKIIDLIKNFDYTIKNLDSFDCAIVTSGGVDIKEINPKNMESKKVKNLFFVGEVLDLDALTGGFNIQIALSTGYVAGKFLLEMGG
ncbi:MAG: NAD(P)/FAD-dependent oxidoreductase [Clostridia bacterium]|nr:NAD(P)/FAD-dependent oxidoreductase [Clostridia bacterium]